MKTGELTPESLAGEVARLRPSESAGHEIAETVAALLADVRDRGDEALVEATARFDFPEATKATLGVSVEELEEAHRSVEPAVQAALEISRENSTFFHRHELRADWEDTGPQGQRLGTRYLPVERAGLYVPGGVGSYASTVVMNAVPALVAGVKELIVCTPPGRDGTVNSSVLAAAHLMGIERVFRVGGAQAIGAMAYGTASVPRVDVICGPGNAFVMEAKRQVYGRVGIDSLAGPSEVLVIADGTARPSWVAADLLAQEEHGSGAQAVLLAESPELLGQVADAVAALRAERTHDPEGSPRAVDIAAGQASEASGETARLWGYHPAAGTDFFEVAAAFVNLYAPEHLELHLDEPHIFLPLVRSAGAIFLGHGTPTAFGDYVAGSNHVLPTGGSARFSSPLSVDTFVRKSSYVEVSPEAAELLTPRLAVLADSEGFRFHRVSAELRAGESEAKADGLDGGGRL